MENDSDLSSEDILSDLLPDIRVGGSWPKPVPPVPLVRYEDLTESSSTGSQQHEETGEERFPLHEACWEGRSEFLLEQLGLDGCRDVLHCHHLEKVLQQTGRVPVCLDRFGHGPSHEDCPQEEGSLILLAVKKRNFALADAMLSALLYRRIKRIDWSNQNCPQREEPLSYPQLEWEEPGREMLRKLLWYMMEKNDQSFSFIFSEDLGLMSEAFLTLATACVLGDKELVEALMEMFPYSEWQKLNKRISLHPHTLYCSTKNFVEKALLVCTSLGGDPGCLCLLRKAFPDPCSFNPAVLRENVLKVVWPWQLMEVPKFLHCLDEVLSISFLESVTEFAVRFLPEPLVQLHGPYLSEDQMKENLAMELVELLRCATNRSQGQSKHDMLLHINTVIHLKRITRCFERVEPESKTAEALQACATYALYLLAPDGILEEDFADELLKGLKGDDRQRVLNTLCQFLLATRSRLVQGCGKGSLHEKVYAFVKRRLASNENLEDLKTLAAFYNISGTEGFQELLKSAAAECGSEQLISLPDPVPSLQHLCMLNFLQRMDRENLLFRELGVPRGLCILTMDNFLKGWQCLAHTPLMSLSP